MHHAITCAGAPERSSSGRDRWLSRRLRQPDEVATVSVTVVPIGASARTGDSERRPSGQVQAAPAPDFPYQRLADAYDVFLPMTYFTFRVTGRFGARWYTAGNIDIIRQQTGDWSVPIHVIGGIGGDATKAETAGFVDAVRGRRAIEGSYYTFPITRPADWSRLERLLSIR